MAERQTENLNDAAAWPFLDDCEEIVIRVSRYDDKTERPACVQAVVKHKNRKMIWGVGIAPNPVVALKQAIGEFYSRNGEPWPSGEEVGQKREPILEEASACGGDPDIDDLLG